MAEETESRATEPEQNATSLTRRARQRKTPDRKPRATTPAQRSTAPASSSRTASTGNPGRVAKPLRSLAILTMVGGLVATVALPAFAAAGGASTDDAVTIQQMAVDEAQSFVAASDASSEQLTRESYSATTAEEIEKKKAEEAAAERARLAAQVASSASAGLPINIAMVSPGSGEVRWPLLNFTKGRGLWDSGYHQGVDLLTSCGTPIYAAAAGVVKVSQESYGGYGVAITIDHVLGGQRVNTLYGHMTYGSRQVSAGQYVEAGQLIGLIGSTGSSTACHLHFEVHINDSVVDPWAWLENNAG